METFEVRSKSFTIKWVNAPEHAVIKWELKPIKHSINMGIYRHVKYESTPQLPQQPQQVPSHRSSAASLRSRSAATIGSHLSLSVDEVNKVPRKLFTMMHQNFFSTDEDTADSSSSINTSTSSLGQQRRRFSVSTSTSNMSSLNSRIGKHLTQEQWVGKCEGDEFVSDSFQVVQAGLYAFVFDNTFSKTKAKKVMFSQWLEDVNGETIRMASKVASHTRSNASIAKPASEPPSTAESIVSYPGEDGEEENRVRFLVPEEKQVSKNAYVIRLKGGVYLQGQLRKKRRRAGGNFVKRFFSLNFKYAVLDYYADETASNIRGDMLVTQTIISADTKQLMFYLDSGMEQWILKALTPDDFKIWVQAFNYIKRRDKVARSLGEEDSHINAAVLSRPGSPLPGTADNSFGVDEFSDAVSSYGGNTIALQRQDVENDIASLQDLTEVLLEKAGSSSKLSPELEQLKKGLSDLRVRYNSVLENEDNYLHPTPSKRGLTRTVTATAATSILSQDFFDAEEVIEEMNDEVQMVGADDDEKLPSGSSRDNIFDEQLIASSASLSSDESPGDSDSQLAVAKSQHLSILQEEAPTPSDLYPLPWNVPIAYRSDVPPAACGPPSLVSIFRKSIGKDLSGMTMPITSNEPLSFLQKYAESYEYTPLLHSALEAPAETGERILRVAAFAISYLSSYRSKERSLRKPFNPLLGETFEMVRPEMNVRLYAEKVVHHPVVFAARIESSKWTIDHAFKPNQKFYGKTAEVSLDGRVILRTGQGEMYEWTQPTTVLKNVISLTGEKYTEPTASMTIRCSTGLRAVATFVPDHSRFTSRRSEKLTIKVTNANGEKLDKTVSGTWTEFLQFDDTNEVFWKVGSLVPEADMKYGFTKFAASLNDMTSIDKECAPTDSRRRPDQKMYEEGDVDNAESLKLDLEQRQRERRKDSTGNAVTHKPAFFRKVGGDTDLDWTPIEGDGSYWERRKNQDWDGLVNLW